jgi:hypothetical protein
VPISSTNTSCLPSSLPNVERHTNLSHSSRSLALGDLFSAVAEALNRPADRCLAHLHSTYSEEKLAPFPVGSPWPSYEVFLKQPHSSLVQLWALAGPPLWGKRAALAESLEITLDRGAVDPEPAGGLAPGDPPSDGLYCLGAKVYRISFHALMVLGGAT